MEETVVLCAPVQIYVEMPSDDERGVVETLRGDLPLIQQLVDKQERGYGIPGIPILHVLVKRSEYEKRFYLNRLRKL